MNGSHDNPVLEDEKHLEVRTEIQTIPNISDEDMFFAKERYKLHQSTPVEGVDIDILKKYFSKKYGF